LGKSRKHNRDAAIARTLDALARGVEIEAVRYPVAEVLLQKSGPAIEGLCLIPVADGGLERRHDGRTALVTMHSIKNHQEMVKAGALSNKTRTVPPNRSKAEQPKQRGRS
jgi:hypothetical protein